jgi:hypothetical protein
MQIQKNHCHQYHLCYFDPMEHHRHRHRLRHSQMLLFLQELQRFLFQQLMKL